MPDPTAIAIRQIRAEDIPGYHATLDSVAREGIYLASLAAPPLAATQVFVTGNIERGYPHLVALAEGQVIGWCDITGTPRPTRAHCATLGMGLLPAWRGQGIGRRLLAAGVEAAWAFGFKRIELSVYANNAAALRLYESLGFAQEGRQRAAARHGEHYVDIIPMALLAAGLPPT